MDADGSTASVARPNPNNPLRYHPRPVPWPHKSSVGYIVPPVAPTVRGCRPSHTQWSPEARSTPQPPQTSAISPPSSPVSESPSWRLLPPTHRRPIPMGGPPAARKPTAPDALAATHVDRLAVGAGSRLPSAGTQAAADAPGTSTSSAPEQAAPTGAESRTAAPMPSSMDHLDSAHDRRLPLSRRGMDEILGEFGAGARLGTRRRRCTDATVDDDWPTPSSSDPATSSSTTGSYDWDAATAAALSDEPATPDAATPPHHHTPTTADRLLEDIIREIVGDAAAETVSSLQPERPAAARRRFAPLPRRGIQAHQPPKAPSSPERPSPSRYRSPSRLPRPRRLRTPRRRAPAEPSFPPPRQFPWSPSHPDVVHAAVPASAPPT